MASTDPVEMLQNEVMCAICRDYLHDPVTIDCGHNYCRTCITQNWKNVDKMFSCPQCRQVFHKRNFMSNWQLANVVEIAKQITFTPSKVHNHNLCDKHEEVAKLYCEVDEAAICLVCRESREHKSHSTVPLEEAVQEYKEKLTESLPPLKVELDEILKHKSIETRKIEAWKKTVELQRQRIMAEFEDLHQVLNREQKVLFSRLEDQKKLILQKLNENVNKLSKQYCSLNKMVMEIDEKTRKPAVELLKDVKMTLSRCVGVKCLQPEDVSVELDWNMYTIPEFCINLRKRIKKYKQDITMDPNTANPELSLSEDHRSIIWMDSKQEVPNNPDRFYPMLCVLGSKAFTGGRQYWEVDVGSGMEWALGVAEESVRRKGWINFSPEEHIWALGLHSDQYQALTSPDWSHISLGESAEKIAIFLDYEGGQLSFYNAETMSHIYTFTVSFSEKIFPFFHTWDKHVPITICA
ncbi:E3 ubiquitin-protein ligase TRIM39-like [Ambystoma mexicanum]|uniref:E3 ubiquitin-protein ligase TRIM39-like n=1 Tax=Ambystoma mexicanum TaxID=8296 RepID=UPI0037E7024A